MATGQNQNKAAEGVSETIHAHEAIEAEIRKERAKDMAVAAFTGILRIAGMAFIGVIAGYSAGIASENYREYKQRKRMQNARNAQDVQYTERTER